MIAPLQQLWHAHLETPVGTLTAIASEAGLAAITFPCDSDSRDSDKSAVAISSAASDRSAGSFVADPASRHLGRLPQRLLQVPSSRSDDRLAPAIAWLRSYFSGEVPAIEALDMPLDPGGTPFERAVWELLCEIPIGQTRSYGQLAAALGKKGAARAVGLANGKNPLPILVPCHRVIGANGKLTGFGGGLWRKELLLGLECGGQLPL